MPSNAPEQAKAYLVGLAGPLAGRRFGIEQKFAIGRGLEGNDIVLPDPEVSRHHAAISVQPDGSALLQDTSANGTFINSVKISSQELKDGDEVQFGPNPESRFKVEVCSSEAGHWSQSPGGGNVAAAPVRAPVPTIKPPEAERQGRRLQLVVDRYVVEEIPLPERRLEIGRTEREGVLVVEHPTVSSKHAVLTMTPQGVVIEDQQSANGTYLNGERIASQLLQEGDLIQLGHCRTHLFLYRDIRPRAAVLSDVDLGLRTVTIVGRDRSCDVVVSHPTVSRRHAEIRMTQGSCVLRDLDSATGTFVNGRAVTTPVHLNNRDRVAFGGVQFSFRDSHLEGQVEGNRLEVRAHNVTFEIAADQAQPKRLLNDVSFTCEPQELVGLLGPSGCGKSTLLKTLVGVHAPTSGSIVINGRDLNSEYPQLKTVIGFVPQDDVLHAALTAYECLHYSARLRLPSDLSDVEREQRVREVLRVVRLERSADIAIKQLSGGQRKRVSVAIELLNKPSLLLLDEPTAGLDPATESELMIVLREVANQGATVILSTHLMGVFSLLDRAVVLAEGRLVYHGSASSMLAFFECRYPQQVYELLTADRASATEWEKRYRASEHYQLSHAAQVTTSTAQSRDLRARPTTSFVTQLRTLLGRQVNLKQKGLLTLGTLLVAPMAVGLLMATMRQPVNAPISLFLAVVICLWFGCATTVREIVDEAPVYRRERAGGLRMSSYLASKVGYMLGIAAAQTGLFVAVLQLFGVMENHWLTAWLFLALISLQGGLIGLVISAWAKSPEAALYWFPLTMIPQLLLAGVLVPLRPVEVWVLETDGKNIVFQADGTPRIWEPEPWIRERLLPKPINSPLIRSMSWVMAARWGLEGLADIYMHDRAPYSFALMSRIPITFHGDESRTTRDLIQQASREELLAFSRERTPSAMRQYLLVLFGFSIIMILVTAVVLKRRTDYAG